MHPLEPHRRDQLIEQWAQAAVRSGLGSLAVFLLEAHRPLAPLGSQVLLGVQPTLALLCRIDATEVAAFLDDPENVERLMRRIEELRDDAPR
jgi:hypothetical protein